MTKRLLLLAVPFLAAASPPQTLSLQVPSDYPFTTSAPVHTPAPSGQAGPVYEPAPLPNPDVSAPSRDTSEGTELSPSLFQRHGGYRGDALSNSESVESDQNRRMMPSAGLTLKMPLQEGTPQQ